MQAEGGPVCLRMLRGGQGGWSGSRWFLQGFIKDFKGAWGEAKSGGGQVYGIKERSNMVSQRVLKLLILLYIQFLQMRLQKDFLTGY